MKKVLFFILILAISSAHLSAQENPTQKDSLKTQPNVEEFVSSESFDGQDDGESEQSNFVPGLLYSSQDVYTNNTSYTFSIAYFRSRGYDNQYSGVGINNFMMNSLINDRASYSQWGGLNHIFRYPETVLNMNSSSFTFGDIGGTVNYSTRASSFRKQVRATYSLTNRTYTNRLMLTAATGLMQNGWSFAASVSGRFGNALSYVDGSSYNAFSYFFSGEKRINDEHAINLTVFGAPTSRSTQANAVQEVYDLLDDNYYNANWGWYNGKQRSARVKTIHEPVAMLTHYFTPKSNKYFITTTLAATFGKNSSTALNWNDVPDPRPDYYRYLPSYQEDQEMKDFYTDQWKNNASVRQINWDNMYEVNQLAKSMGERAQYMVENRIYGHMQFGGASNLVMDINDNIKLSAGIDIRGMKQRNYKTINDLLGGSYWLDVDKYSEGDFPEDYNVIYNDLQNKNKKLYEGDVFGYDYDYVIYNQLAWGMLNFSYNQIDFHVGAKIGGNEFWRNGHMQNGRFPEESFGKSEVKSFLTGGGKAGITYKITGRNYLVLNGQVSADAPSVLNSFVSPRVRNKMVVNLECEKTYSADFSYIMSYPFMKMRLTAYYTYFQDKTKVTSFYHDDYASMVNYVMTGIDQQHVGIELGAEIKLGAMFSLVLAGNFGDYRYKSRPYVSINAENGYDILGDYAGDVSQEVYWKNYHVSGSPQAAGTIGLKFNHNYWWVNINANYFDKIYCDLNPERRTTAARGTLDENSDLYKSIVAQERLKGQFTLDASLSKSWRISNKYTIGFNISVTNILNNKNLVTTAWEQYRFDFTENNVDKFANKYYYAFGTTFYAGLNFQF